MKGSRSRQLTTDRPASPAGHFDEFDVTRYFCPEAAGLSDHDPDRSGRCRWCGRKTSTAVPQPPPDPSVKSDLDLAYGYHYDPDFGEDRRDVY